MKKLFLLLLLNSMFGENKIGQCVGIAVSIANKNTAQRKKIYDFINEHQIGSILLDQRGTIADQVTIINEIITSCPHHPLILQDLEWGLTMRLNDGLCLPHALTCGAIQDNELIYELGKEIGRQCKLLGVDINLAPDADLNTNPRNPVIHDRSFGENRERATPKIMAYLNGLMASGVLGCLKHFPGHGDTSIDSHLDLPVIHHSIERLNEIELYPFKYAIAQGAPCIMPAHIITHALDDQPATLSHKTLTDLLRNNFKFNGLLITDALRMHALTNYFDLKSLLITAFKAGNDILLAPPQITKALALLEKAVTHHLITQSEIDERVERIKQAKQFVQIAQKNLIDIKTIYQMLVTPEALKLKKQLYREAITLVQDKEKLIPFKPDQNYAIVHFGNKSVSSFEKEIKENLETTSHFLSLQPSGLEITELESSLEFNETLIVTIAQINKNDHDIFGISPLIVDLLHRLKANGKKIILTIFGTPYSLKFFEKMSTVIMAYEDDPDAQEAAAQVIMGKLTPTGALPVIPSLKFK